MYGFTFICLSFIPILIITFWSKHCRRAKVVEKKKKKSVMGKNCPFDTPSCCEHVCPCLLSVFKEVDVALAIKILILSQESKSTPSLIPLFAQWGQNFKLLMNNQKCPHANQLSIISAKFSSFLKLLYIHLVLFCWNSKTGNG